jgi:hypothetical protein
MLVHEAPHHGACLGLFFSRYCIRQNRGEQLLFFVGVVHKYGFCEQGQQIRSDGPGLVRGCDKVRQSRHLPQAIENFSMTFLEAGQRCVDDGLVFAGGKYFHADAS